MFKVNQEALVNRGSMIIEHAHLAIRRIRAICLDISAGSLWRTDIEIQERGVLFTSLHPNIGNINHVVGELLGESQIPRLQIKVGMLSAGRYRHDIRDGRREGRRDWIRQGRHRSVGRSAVTAVAVEQTKARVIRRVELQDIDVVELPGVVTDAVASAHYHQMRQAIGKPEPWPKVLARDVPYGVVVSEGHQHYRVDGPVYRLGGVERVRRGR